MGYYSAEERARGYKKKDFKKAKFDFVDEMLHWSGAQQPQRILDVGCGIGGTSRHLAARFPNALVQGAHYTCCVQSINEWLVCLRCIGPDDDISPQVCTEYSHLDVRRSMLEVMVKVLQCRHHTFTKSSGQSH